MFLIWPTYTAAYFQEKLMHQRKHLAINFTLLLSSSEPKFYHFQIYYTIFEIKAGNELSSIWTVVLCFFRVQSKRYFKCFPRHFVLEMEFCKRENSSILNTDLYIP